MKRLRHPINSIREPFGKAGLTVAILALAMALVGGAYAAGGLTKSQEKQVTKIAKKYAGKPGAPGAAGTNGTNGAAGKEGAAGKAGEAGKNGESVTTSAAGGECPAGGTKFKVGATESHVCNGKEGEPGAIHPGETLPSGASETGVWSFGGVTKSGATESLPISFPIQLAEPIAESGIQFNPEGFPSGATQQQEENCPGNAGEPKAKGGFLCVYAGVIVTATPLGIHNPATFSIGASVAGAVFFVEPVAEGAAGLGTWAVTAE